MANILIIEDELNVAAFIRKGIEEEGHHTDVAYDGKIGLNMSLSQDYDLVILDIVLPVMNGIEVCREFRKQRGFSVPILMLSALGSTDDIVSGLETGADDYLVKPFRFKELLARVNALKRRKSQSPAGQIMRIADLEMNLDSRTVTRSDKSIALTSKEFRLLEYFMSNQNRVLTRTRILEHVWEKDTDVNTNIVDVYVNYLRSKIDREFPARLIHTVVGMGYVLKQE